MSTAPRHPSASRVLTFLSLLAVAVPGCDGQLVSASDGAEPSLAELCAIHKTDKCSVYVEDHREAKGHDYLEVYEKFFEPIRFEAERIFEIGVWRGDSLRLWAAYFPNARIFGIDIEDTSMYATERITTFVADQSDREQLRKFIEAHGGDFDVIIDDGGHSMKQQQVSFGYLFRFVRPGGYYVIEDVHTSFLDPTEHPQFGVSRDRQNTTFHMIQRHAWTRSFESPYMTGQEKSFLDRHVESCLYWSRATGFHSDLFLCKKKGDSPAQILE